MDITLITGSKKEILVIRHSEGACDRENLSLKSFDNRKPEIAASLRSSQ
jgi:hypothetical protein